MPNPLQLQIVFNPAQPRREVFLDSPVTFGREAGNRIVLPEAVISRQHGKIEFENDQWVLHNLSDNGTLVNGKSVGKKGRPLADRDVVSVGDRKLFSVILEAQNTNGDVDTTNADVAASPADAAAARKKRLMKYLAIILGGYVIVAVFLSTLGTDTPKSTGPKATLSARDIELDVRRAPKKVTPDERLGAECLDNANQFYGTRASDPGHTYRAYKNYQQALAYLNKTSFDDSLAQLQYLEVQDELVRRVTDEYKRGVTQFQSRQYDEAEATFSRLRRVIYPDPESIVSRNIDEQRALIGPNLKKKRR